MIVLSMDSCILTFPLINSSFSLESNPSREKYNSVCHLLFAEIPCKIHYTDYKLKRQCYMLYVITCPIFNDLRTFDLLFSTKYTKEKKEKQNILKGNKKRIFGLSKSQIYYKYKFCLDTSNLYPLIPTIKFLNKFL